MSLENPHFGFGHACAGCELTETWHTGCVTGHNVRIYSGKPQHYGKSQKTVEVFNPATNVGQQVEEVNPGAPAPVQK
jgi:hypothetical protein